tara:strand:- start:188 stop:8374 length:8187 start_codon:yes stop_codon:yes gene_type:complete
MSKFNTDNVTKIVALEANDQGVVSPKVWIKTSLFPAFTELKTGAGYLFYKKSDVDSHQLCSFEFVEPPVQNPLEERVEDLIDIQDSVGFSSDLFSDGLENNDQLGIVVANSHGSEFIAACNNNTYIQKYKKNEDYLKNPNIPTASKESWIFHGPRLNKPEGVSGDFGKHLSATGDLKKVLISCTNKVFLYEYSEDAEGVVTWEQKEDIDLTNVADLEITKDGKSFVAVSSDLDSNGDAQVVCKSLEGDEYKDIGFDLKHPISNVGANPTSISISNDGENLIVGIPDEKIGTEDIGGAGVIHVYSKQAATITETDDQGNVTSSAGFKFYLNKLIKGSIHTVPPGVSVGEGLGYRVSLNVTGLNSNNLSSVKYRIISTANSIAGMNPANLSRSRGKINIYEYRDQKWEELASTQFGDSWAKAGGFGTGGFAVNDVGNRIAVGAPHYRHMPDKDAEYETLVNGANTVPYYEAGVTLENLGSGDPNDATMTNHSLRFDAVESFESTPDKEAQLYYNDVLLAKITFPDEYLGKPATFYKNVSAGPTTEAQPFYFREGAIDLQHDSGAIYIFDFNYVTNTFELVSKTVNNQPNSKVGGRFGDANTLFMPCLGFRLFIGNPTHDLQDKYIDGVGSNVLLKPDSGIVLVAKIAGAEEKLITYETDTKDQLYLNNYMVTDTGDELEELGEIGCEDCWQWSINGRQMEEIPISRIDENNRPDLGLYLNDKMKSGNSYGVDDFNIGDWHLTHNYPKITLDPSYGSFKATAEIIDTSYAFPSSSKRTVQDWPDVRYDPTTQPDHESTRTATICKLPETYTSTNFNITYGNFIHALKITTNNDETTRERKNIEFDEAVTKIKFPVFANEGHYLGSNSTGYFAGWYGTTPSRRVEREWASWESGFAGWKEFVVTYQSEECPEYSFTRTYKILENPIFEDYQYYGDYGCPNSYGSVMFRGSGRIDNYAAYVSTVTIPVTIITCKDGNYSTRDVTVSLDPRQSVCSATGYCESLNCCDDFGPCMSQDSPDGLGVIPCRDPNCTEETNCEESPCCDDYRYEDWDRQTCRCNFSIGRQGPISSTAYFLQRYRYDGSYRWWESYPEYYGGDGVNCGDITSFNDLLRCGDFTGACYGEFEGDADDDSATDGLHFEGGEERITSFSPSALAGGVSYSDLGIDWRNGEKLMNLRRQYTTDADTGRSSVVPVSATGAALIDGDIQPITGAGSASIYIQTDYNSIISNHYGSLARVFKDDDTVHQAVYYIENVTDKDISFTYSKRVNYFTMQSNHNAVFDQYNSTIAGFGNDSYVRDISTNFMYNTYNNTDVGGLQTFDITLPPGKGVYVEAAGYVQRLPENDILKIIQNLFDILEKAQDENREVWGLCGGTRESLTELGAEQAEDALQSQYDELKEMFGRLTMVNARDSFYWNGMDFQNSPESINKGNFEFATSIVSFNIPDSPVITLMKNAFGNLPSTATVTYVENDDAPDGTLSVDSITEYTGNTIVGYGDQVARIGWGGKWKTIDGDTVLWNRNNSTSIRRSNRELLDVGALSSMLDGVIPDIELMTGVINVLDYATAFVMSSSVAVADIKGLNANIALAHEVENIPASRTEGEYFTPGEDSVFEYSLEYSDVVAVAPPTEQAEGELEVNPHYRQYGQTITKADPDNTFNFGSRQGEGFGNTVTMSDDGERLFTVSYGIDGPNNATASILFVYKWNSSTEQWVEEFTYEGDTYSRTGSDIACNYDGTRFAASSVEAAKIYVFDYSGGSWSLTTTIDGTDPSNGYSANSSFFGASIDFSNSGDILAIGSPYHGDGGNLAVYNFTTSTLTSIADGTFSNGESELLGSAVAIGGRSSTAEANDCVVAVGIPNRWVTNTIPNVLEATQYGCVEIYKLSDNSLSQTIDGIDYQSNFGSSLDFSATASYLAIGATGHQYRGGEVHIYSNDLNFTLSPDTHNLIFKQMVTNNVPNDGFGNSVAISVDGRLIVGSPSYDDSRDIAAGSTGNDAGRINMFYCEIAANCNDYDSHSGNTYTALSTESFAEINDGIHMRTSVIDTEDKEGQYAIGKNNDNVEAAYEFQRMGQSVSMSSNGERFVVASPFWYEYTGGNVEEDGPKNVGRVRTYQKQTVDEPCVASVFAGNLEDNLCHKTSGASDAVTLIQTQNSGTEQVTLKVDMVAPMADILKITDLSQTKTVTLQDTSTETVSLCDHFYGHVIIEDPNYPIDRIYHGSKSQVNDPTSVSLGLRFSNTISKDITNSANLSGWGHQSEGEDTSAFQWTITPAIFESLYQSINERRDQLGTANVAVPSATTTLNYYVFINDFEYNDTLYNSCKTGTITYTPFFSSDPSDVNAILDTADSDGGASNAYLSNKITFTVTPASATNITSYLWYKRSRRDSSWMNWIDKDLSVDYMGGDATTTHYGSMDADSSLRWTSWEAISSTDAKFSGQGTQTLTLESISPIDHKTEYRAVALDTDGEVLGQSRSGQLTLINDFDYANSSTSGIVHRSTGQVITGVNLTVWPINHCDNNRGSIVFRNLPPSTDEYDSFVFAIMEFQHTGSITGTIEAEYPLILPVDETGKAEEVYYASYGGNYEDNWDAQKASLDAADQYMRDQGNAGYYNWGPYHTRDESWFYRYYLGNTATSGLNGIDKLGGGIHSFTKVQHFYAPKGMKFGSDSQYGLYTSLTGPPNQTFGIFLTDMILKKNNFNNARTNYFSGTLNEVFVASSYSTFGNILPSSSSINIQNPQDIDCG